MLPDGVPSLFEWVPLQRVPSLSFWSAQFYLACVPSVVLCCLSLSKRWARFTDSPRIFAVVYGMPFFLLTSRIPSATRCR